MQHNEFVVELVGGKRDWIDPVEPEDIQITDTQIFVRTGYRIYSYDLQDVEKWTIRPYSITTTYDRI